MTGSGNNTYLVIGSDRTSVLIDAGVGHPLHQAELAHALDVHGVRLTRVLLTHGHADHASGAGEIAAKYPGLEDFMIHWAEGLSAKEFKEQLAWFARDVMPAFQAR